MDVRHPMRSGGLHAKYCLYAASACVQGKNMYPCQLEQLIECRGESLRSPQLARAIISLGKKIQPSQ